MKGVSDMDAQNNKKIDGNKKEAKKPIQVLHISKKDPNTVKREPLDDNQNLSEEKNAEIKSKKPQTVDASLNEEKISYPNNINFENVTHKELAKPLNLQDEDFIIERKVDEFDFDESAFLEALNENEPIGALSLIHI